MLFTTLLRLEEASRKRPERMKVNPVTITSRMLLRKPSALKRVIPEGRGPLEIGATSTGFSWFFLRPKCICYRLNLSREPI